jgi:hypothetical protein
MFMTSLGRSASWRGVITEAARAAPGTVVPGAAGRSSSPPAAFPATAFYDSSGELAFTHQGVYEHQEQLAADIDRYAALSACTGWLIIGS